MEKSREFLEWIDKEIDKIKNFRDEDTLFIQGKLSEAFRIRAMYKQIGEASDNRKTVEEMEKGTGSGSKEP